MSDNPDPNRRDPRHRTPRGAADREAIAQQEREAARQAAIDQGRQLPPVQVRAPIRPQQVPVASGSRGGPQQQQQQQPQQQQQQRPQQPQHPIIPINPEMATDAFRAMVIPNLNGNIEVGISAGVEAQLKQEDFLEVFTIPPALSPVGQAPMAGAVNRQWLPDTMRMTLLHLAHKSANLPARTRDFLVVGAYVALQTNQIGYDDEQQLADAHPLGVVIRPRAIKGSDWVHVENFDDQIVTAELAAYVTGVLTTQNIRVVGTMIAAAKVNFFKENHHVGQQGQESGAFVRKAIEALLPGEDINVMKSVIHRVAHWCSTRSVLRQLGVNNLKPFAAITATFDHLTASNDISIRLKSPPAGTARLAVAYALFSRMIKHPVAAFCPAIEDYADIRALYQQIMANPMSYHMGAAALCTHNARINFRDEKHEALLGRVGTWGAIYSPKSSIMSSPHISNKRYMACTDFDTQFESFCLAWKMAATQRLKKVLKVARRGRLEISAGYAAMCQEFLVQPSAEAMQVVAAAAAPIRPQAQAPDDDSDIDDEDME